MGAPAAAPAQSLEQTCRDAESVPGTCVGVAKLTQRATAECRRAGVEAERCTAPFAARVSSDDVHDYRSSFVHKALVFQYRLGNGLPLRDAPWIGTHNSFNSTSEDPTLSHTDSNQQLTLTDQLQIDVRSLELDVHWFPSARAGGQAAPVVCHARGANEGHAGCTSERLLGERLDEIAAWLRRWPGEVVLLYIEDNVDTAAGYDPTAAAIDAHLRDEDGSSLVYRTGGSSCRQMPLSLTRDDVLAAGAQVVIVSGCGQGAAWRGLVFDWNSGVEVEERPHGYRDFPVCDQDPDGDGRPDISSGDYATKMVRYYEDSTWLSPAASNVGLGSPDDGLTPETTRRMVRCGVDLFGFDQILPDDGRLAAAVWSWADGERFWGDTGCPAQGEDGRWRLLACADSRPAACATPAGGWAIAAAGPYETAAARCAATGLTLGVPRTGNQNARLHQIASSGGASPVWLARPPL